MISIYSINEYIKLIKSKRRHFYYLNTKSRLYKNYTKKALKMVNNILFMLGGYFSDSYISVDADGWYVIFNDIGIISGGHFNSDYLNGLQ